VGGCTGVFSVATPPAHRRRGYGAALTARAVTDGLAAGAAWAWLQSSPPGYGIYARLGFRTVETRACWIARRLSTIGRAHALAQHRQEGSVGDWLPVGHRGWGCIDAT
jgi:hypothetical protein